MAPAWSCHPGCAFVVRLGTRVVAQGSEDDAVQGGARLAVAALCEPARTSLAREVFDGADAGEGRKHASLLQPLGSAVLVLHVTPTCSLPPGCCRRQRIHRPVVISAVPAPSTRLPGARRPGAPAADKGLLPATHHTPLNVCTTHINR
jgi:hypothetical protein